ncbi:CGI-121-domain-containing protein, partial [Patellaria atrata CBS 101060]
MANLTTLHLPHLPDVPVHVAAFKDVRNAAFLRQQLIEGNREFEYAFLDCATILSTRHVLAAVFRAMNDARYGRLKSRNVHSEVVFCLSGNNNIVDSFRYFGLTPTTTSLIAIKIPSIPSNPSNTITQTPPQEAPSNSLSPNTISSHLLAAVEGTPIPFTDKALTRFTDLGRVRKVYKVGGMGKGKGKIEMNGGNGVEEE